MDNLIKHLVIIPARAGSKSIPKKNLKKVGGISIIRRACLLALALKDTEVIVSTDDSEVINEIKDLEVVIFARSAEYASDFATTEESMLEVLENIHHSKFNSIVLIQPTSPFINPKDLEKGLEIYKENNELVPFLAVSHKCYNWLMIDQKWVPSKFDSNLRSPRQQTAESIIETGGFWIMNKKNFLNKKSRYCGIPIPIITKKIYSYEIDEPEDLYAAQDMAERIDRELPHLKLDK